MNKVVSFCLWGNNKLYTHGAIANAELMSEIYPGWIMFLYYDYKTVPIDIVKKLESLNVRMIPMICNPDSIEAMFWRFRPATLNNVEIMLSRDCDSRLDYREKACVEEWLSSDKIFHSIRDHQFHNVPILGGMWGLKQCSGNIIKNYMLDNWPKKKNKGDDQLFLTNIIWPLVKDSCMGHDERFDYPGNKPFPKHLPNKYSSFVGEIIKIRE